MHYVKYGWFESFKIKGLGASMSSWLKLSAFENYDFNNYITIILIINALELFESFHSIQIKYSMSLKNTFSTLIEIFN